MDSNIFSMIFWVILVLGALVFFHELGHFLAAKLSGIRVEKFSIGFPPRLFGKKIGETDYCLQLIPLGGYCKMAGMVDETLDTDGIKGEQWEFMSKPIPIRMFVLFAGPLMNFILAFVLFSIYINFIGIRDYSEESVVGNVTAGTPAEEIGLLPGDKIAAIDGESIESWMEMAEIIQAKPLETVSLMIERDDILIEEQVAIALYESPEGQEQMADIGRLGIERFYLDRDVGFLKSIDLGMRQTATLTLVITNTVKSLITGKESIKALGGPLMIAKMTDDFRRTGTAEFIFFVAFLSLNLGFMNLLPVPVLDGGHLLILMVEGMSRKQLPVKARIVIQQIGMALLLVLVAVILYNDIIRLTSSTG